MTHLRIEQNGTDVSTLSNKLIPLLYNYAISGTLDSTSNLKGIVNVNHCKSSQRQYLMNKYPEFSITCTGEYYIDFEDPVVEQICADTWGDGIGLTFTQAAAVTSYGNVFQGNTQITSFNEMQYFTSAVYFMYTYGNGSFTNCTSLTSVDLRNVAVGDPSDWWTNMNLGGAFKGCSSLEIVYNYHPLRIAKNMFSGCTSLHTLDLSNVEYIGESSLNHCSSLNLAQNGLDFTKIKSIDSWALWGCADIGDIQLPQCTYFGGGAFQGCDSLTSISNCQSLTTLYAGGNGWVGDYSGWECCIMSKGIDTIDLSDSSVGTIPYMACGCTLLRIVKLPATVTQINSSFVRVSPQLQAVVILATVPPTVTDGANILNDFNNVKIYVPDASVNDYKTAQGWSNKSSFIFGMSQYAIDFPND